MPHASMHMRAQRHTSAHTCPTQPHRCIHVHAQRNAPTHTGTCMMHRPSFMLVRRRTFCDIALRRNASLGLPAVPELLVVLIHNEVGERTWRAFCSAERKEKSTYASAEPCIRYLSCPFLSLELSPCLTLTLSGLAPLSVHPDLNLHAPVVSLASPCSQLLGSRSFHPAATWCTRSY